jgi:hypothetical protein
VLIPSFGLTHTEGRPSDQGTTSMMQFRKFLTRINHGANADVGDDDTLERLELDICILSSMTVKDSTFCVPVVIEENGAIWIDLSNFSGRIRIREHNTATTTTTAAPIEIKRTLRIHSNDSDQTSRSNPVVEACDLVKELNDTLFDKALAASAYVSGTRKHDPSDLQGLIEGNTQALVRTQKVNHEDDDSCSSSDTEEDDNLENSSMHRSTQRRQQRPPSQEFLSDVSSSNVHASGQTPLHRLLASQDVTVGKVQDIIKQNPAMLRIRDSNGRLPLHILGNNCDLLSTLAGQAVAKQCAMLLMDAFPANRKIVGRRTQPDTILKTNLAKRHSSDARPCDKDAICNSDHISFSELPFSIQKGWG